MGVVLVVAAHPDDEVLGAGGTLAKHVASGDQVHAIVLSEGASSRYAAEGAGLLRDSATRSAEAIGLTSIHLLDLPDQRLDAIPLIEVTHAVEEVVLELRPETVYTHTPVDVNADHGVVARATWTACRPYAAPWLHRILAFETPSSTEWAWPLEGSSFQPNWFVDIAGTLDRKLEAVSCYTTELRDYPHPRSLQALTERARFWGSHVGVAAAEPFILLRGRG
ncbi:PIG-L deacetylase family protein [Ornithinimicrobium cryptoxanthini]|uniref:PIG-L deacetylase family protein n=1 Tax=Ornithinimicrobium cryptoxanthini TaxID=2934161 RepID=UPI0021174A2D|nr:PIG-L deacetylase family protein [Ornithinimicrobium cryptoxanthini]